MSGPQPNLPLLRKTWEKINEIPSGKQVCKKAARRGTNSTWPEIMQAAEVDAAWVQSTWGATTRCGTYACFAGWACELNGDPLDANGVVWLDNRSFCSPATRAESVLGLTAEEADRLFSANNSRADIRRTLVTVFERAGERFE